MEISEILKSSKDYFNSKHTLPYSFRLSALKKLKSEILLKQVEIADAIKLDLGKSFEESYMSEIGMVLSELHMQFIILKNGWKEKG